jgi:hypothetical protein
MKRLLSITLCMAILLSFPFRPLDVSAAAEYAEEAYSYTVSSGEATITGYDS